MSEVKTVQISRHDELDAQFDVIKQSIRDSRKEEQGDVELTQEQKEAIELARGLGLTASARKPGIGKVTNGIAVQEALNLYIATHGLEDDLDAAMSEPTETGE